MSKNSFTNFLSKYSIDIEEKSHLNGEILGNTTTNLGCLGDCTDLLHDAQMNNACCGNSGCTCNGGC